MTYERHVRLSSRMLRAFDSLTDKYGFEYADQVWSRWARWLYSRIEAEGYVA